MDKFILGLLLGLVIGAAGVHWLNRGGENRNNKARAEQKDGALSQYGVVIREKAKEAGAAIADAASDTRITTAIKGKLAAELGAWSVADVSVNTSAGVVTLAGSVQSSGDIDKAVNAAYTADGVRRVYSTMQVREKK